LGAEGHNIRGLSSSVTGLSPKEKAREGEDPEGSQGALKWPTWGGVGPFSKGEAYVQARLEGGREFPKEKQV